MNDSWIGAFPALHLHLDRDSVQLLTTQARVVTLPAGAAVFREGGPCQTYLLVLDGSVRVQKVSESGREIVLYRVERGQSCVLTTSCLLTGADYAAEGMTETAVTAAAIPEHVFQALLAQSAVFRGFVFSTYAARIADLLALIEEVAFGRIDMRLAAQLLDHADAAGGLTTTHHELAVELGTVREVVSRQLKEFERRGLVDLHRGRLELRDATGLRALAKKGLV